MPYSAKRAERAKIMVHILWRLRRLVALNLTQPGLHFAFTRIMSLIFDKSSCANYGGLRRVTQQVKIVSSK